MRLAIGFASSLASCSLLSCAKAKQEQQDAKIQRMWCEKVRFLLKPSPCKNQFVDDSVMVVCLSEVLKS
jgi:hypothetical protein